MNALEPLLRDQVPAQEFTWADSELAGVDLNADSVVLRLAAARLAGTGERYLQGLQLQLQGTVQAGQPREAVGRVVAGSLLIDGQPRTQLPAPCLLEGRIQLQLQLGHGGELLLHGTRLQVLPPSQPQPIEHLSC